jgi:uncharacterized protein (TIGR04255 family)
MPFPDSPRVIYKKNPLTEVLCQLRFPSILRIDAEPPAAFQERVRRQYPLYREGIRQEIALPQLPKQIAQRLVEELGFHKIGRAYDFLSADSEWTVGLTRDFLALSTQRYERWERFREHLQVPLRSLLEEYAPLFFTRIGLRYQDIIRRSTLGQEDARWSKLLQPHISGELASDDVAGDLESTMRQTVIRLPDGRSRVRIIHGLIELSEPTEVCYVIDSDFYTDQQTEPEDAIDTLNAFNTQARRLFRWCITDRLHQSMDPQPI